MQVVTLQLSPKCLSAFNYSGTSLQGVCSTGSQRISSESEKVVFSRLRTSTPEPTGNHQQSSDIATTNSRAEPGAALKKGPATGLSEASSATGRHAEELGKADFTQALPPSQGERLEELESKAKHGEADDVFQLDEVGEFP